MMSSHKNKNKNKNLSKRQPSPSSAVWDVVRSFSRGLLDALSLHRTLLFFLTSQTVRKRSMQCFVMNGGIFLGSILAIRFVLSPLMNGIVMYGIDEDAASGDAGSGGSGGGSGGVGEEKDASQVAEEQLVMYLHGVMSHMFFWLYQLLWIYPVYCISFVMSAMWYQDIAEHTYVIRGGKKAHKPLNFQRWINAMSQEIYILILIGTFMVQIMLLSLIPYVGRVLTFVQWCWTYALYSFQYRWALERWTIDQQLSYFETRWPYFAGFGFPLAVLTYVFPGFISAGVYALTFPVFIILAIVAKPTMHCAPLSAELKQAGASAPGHLPIFRYAQIVDVKLLSWIRRTCTRRRNNNRNARVQPM